MNEMVPAISIEIELARTRRAQSEAADPLASVWVSANAGTGKTHVLTMRVLRLMLAGTPPERILCLTYTKAAAAEMSKRVFGELGTWVLLADEDLKARLRNLLGREAAPDELDRARTLFTSAIESPGGLKVQTIHAFAERLLQRFPLEAGVTPGFSILDEETGRALVREAIDAVLGAAARRQSAELAEALDVVVAYAGDEAFDDILADALDCRDWLKGRSFREVEHALGRHFGVRPNTSLEEVQAELANVLNEASLHALRAMLEAGSKSENGLAYFAALAAGAASPASRVEALRSLFLTGGGEGRKRLLTKPTAAANAGAEAQLRSAQERFITLDAEYCGLIITRATAAIYSLARAVMERYGAAKVGRSALDFDDLIEKTQHLLSGRGAAEWVLYKLDEGVDHILVDESQDTSPGQWDIVAALTREFFSGAGAREQVRTVFAVGDEKQSIYSFQGAAPRMFAEMGRQFAGMARDAGRDWRRIPLNVSFRSVSPVLAAVDQVLAGAGAVERAGHIPHRCGHGGVVEVWPTETHTVMPEADVWAPLDEGTAAHPVTRLAERIADTIKAWIGGGELLASRNSPIRPGDILILVRKRAPFAGPMVAALKARDIAVAGADRIRLSEQIAVEDLISLGDFITLPEDDLALAEVLKSPMFGFDDDDLLALAYGRKGTLWKALLDRAAGTPRYAVAAACLKRWRKDADFSPPYEFFSRILDGEGMRAKLIARLGPDAADPIDEFQALALTYDDGAPPSLTGFLTWLREGDREVRRDMEQGRDEVRVMTVHGAKGLEAPIVFLADTCAAACANRRGGGVLKVKGCMLDEGETDLFLWPVKGTSRHPIIQQAKADSDTAERAEHDRLLYVAMTRARDRLYVAGFEGKKGRGADCWYDKITAALGATLETTEAPDGRPVFRLTEAQVAAPETAKQGARGDEVADRLPEWSTRRAPREPQLTVPLAPSRLAPYDTDEAGEPLKAERPPSPLSEPPLSVGVGVAGAERFLRGTLTHGLLEHLPGFDRSAWPMAAKGYVEKAGAALPAHVRGSIVAETLAILNDPTFAPLFGERSRAEVPVAAVIPRPSGAGPALRLGGQIDRLVELDREVLIVDYKTNRAAARDVSGVADIYLYQLAAYRLALQEIFQNKTVRAALLWTDGPSLMEIPSALLDTYGSRLWELDPDLLDG